MSDRDRRPAPEPPILRAEGLVKYYSDGHVQALRGVSLEINAGEFGGDHRPQRLRQEHALALARRPRSADRGRGLLPRTAAVPARHRRLPRPPGRLRLPVVLSPAHAHGAREHPDPDVRGPWPPRERVAAGRATSSRRSGSPTAAATAPASSRSASASGSRSRGRSPTTPACSWPTSRPATSTARARTRSFTCCIASATERQPHPGDRHPQPRRRPGRRPADPDEGWADSAGVTAIAARCLQPRRCALRISGACGTG